MTLLPVNANAMRWINFLAWHWCLPSVQLLLTTISQPHMGHLLSVEFFKGCRVPPQETSSSSTRTRTATS